MSRDLEVCKTTGHVQRVSGVHFETEIEEILTIHDNVQKATNRKPVSQYPIQVNMLIGTSQIFIKQGSKQPLPSRFLAFPTEGL